MKYGLLSLLALVFALALIDPVVGVKKYLFKTCDQNPFCKRNRHYADHVTAKGNGWTSPYSLIPESVKIDNDKITGTVLKTVGDLSFNLPLEVSFLSKGGVRVIIDEQVRQDNAIEIFGHESVNKQRFNLSDYFVSNPLQLADPTNKELTKSATSVQVQYEDECSLEIQHNPLKFTFKRRGKPEVVLNGKSWMNLEHWRPIEGENLEKHRLDVEIDDGSWEDEFDKHKDKKSRGPESVALDTTFVGYRHVYGIPEHADKMSLRETRGGDGNHADPYRLFNVDIFEYETDSEMPMYGSIPFMTAQKKDGSAGVFWANAADTYVDITKSKSETTSHWISEAGVMDVFVFLSDSPEDINRQYGEVTGNAALPQEFAIGYNQCRWNYNSQDDVLEVHENFDIHDIPYDVIWLDIEYTEEKKYFTWNEALFPDHVAMANQLDGTGRKLVAIIDPHIKNADNYDVVKTVKGEQIAIKDAKNELFYGHCWPGESVWIDAMHPEAQEAWDKLFAKSASFGGPSDNLHIWNDMNEPSVFSGSETTMFKDGLHYGGWEHRDIHNVWGMTFHEATLNAMNKRYDYKQRPMILTRSYFAGSQRIGPMWTGDNMSKWEYLQVATPMVLTSGIAGMPFAGADVGGFFGDPSPELLTRWYQTGAFHPFFRAHAHIDSKRREPWMAGEPYNTTARDAILLRYRLLPTFYTAFHEASTSLSPILKPLFYVAPQNEKSFDIDDQFFVGNSGILVKPIVHEGVTKTDVYIPDNEIYYGFDDYKVYTGVGNHAIEAPLAKIPMLLRGGHIHAERPRPRRSVELKKHDPYTLVVTAPKSGTANGDLYGDDGVSYEYQKGKYFQRNFTFDGSTFRSTGKSNKDPFGRVKVEKVVLIGYKLKSAHANVEQNGKQWKTQVLNENGALVIRNPKVVIGSDFTITLGK